MQRLRTRLRAGASTFPSATFALNFLTGGLDPRITFSRGSNATLVDSTGKITYAPANLLTYSEQFDNAAWTKSAVTITANATAAPDGTSTADKFTPDVTLAPHFAGQTVTTTAVAHTYSAYLKAGGYSWAILYAAGVNQGVYFDLANGVVGSSFIGAPTSSSITPVGNGWYRCSITFTATTGTAARVYASSANTVSTFAGDGTSGIFIWGAQLEPVTYQTTAGPYVATTASAYYGPRFDYDPVTLAAKGLLIEEQRTNLVLYSQQFGDAAWLKSITTVTENTTVSPDGTANADTYAATASGAGAARQVYQLSKTLTAIPYTWSVYAKAKELNWLVINAFDGTNRATYFNLANGTVGTVAAGDTATIQNAGNGWYRCSVTRTAAATANGGVSFELTTGDNVLPINANLTAGFGIFLYGAQLEAGAFATSYIPTVASQVTRSADVAVMTGTNFSSWYNQSEGTFVTQASTFKPPSVSASNSVIFASDGTANERIQIVYDAGNITSAVFDNGGFMAGFATAYTTGQITNSAIAYKVNDFAASFNGGTATIVTSGTIPTVNRLSIGSGWDGANFFLNGHIRQIAYYNTRLPNATLQALTA